MANVLITTLGKASPINGHTSAHGRYRTLKYAFGDDYTSSPTAFFGKALFDYLCRGNQKVDKLVILGTSGSMWDAWLEADEQGKIFFENENYAGILQAAVDNNSVTADCLGRLSEILGGFIGIPVFCKLIPYGLNTNEQLEILGAIAESGEDGDSVFMDVTHGLRHLPMLEMLSSFLMRSRFETRGVFYGAAELRQDDVAPMIGLDGALRLYDWIRAVAILRETGNVSVLANLSGMEGLREALLKCQFYEQMNDVAQARRYASQVLAGLDQLPAIGRLFRKEIEDVFSWASGTRYAERQFMQAEKAYRNGDYLRSVILFMETVITARISSSGNALNAKTRQLTQERLNKGNDREWHVLRQLRNSLAHGGTPEGRNASDIIAMRQDEARFESEMESIVRWVRCNMSGKVPSKYGVS